MRRCYSFRVIPFEDTSYYTSAAIAGPTASAVTAALVGLAGFISLLSVALGLMRYASTRAREAKIAEKEAETRKLSPGYAIVHGQVETGDALPAVSVRIRQTGREYAVKNGMRHVWTEVDRQVDARPFHLRLATGERVRVLPGDDVFLVDVLGIEPSPELRPVGASALERVRTAQLAHPDYAYACGRLSAPLASSAYRSSEDGFTLHPWQGKMLLSAEPLEERFARRARFHLGWVLGLVVGLLFTNAYVLGDYWLELLWGQSVTAHVTQTGTWTTRNKNNVTQHYGVTVTAAVGDEIRSLSIGTSYEFYRVTKADLAQGRPVDAPFIIVPFRKATFDIGTRPTLHGLTCFMCWLLLGGLAAGYFLHARHTRPWYERNKVKDVGSGPLGALDTLA